MTGVMAPLSRSGRKVSHHFFALVPGMALAVVVSSKARGRSSCIRPSLALSHLNVMFFGTFPTHATFILIHSESYQPTQLCPPPTPPGLPVHLSRHFSVFPFTCPDPILKARVCLQPALQPDFSHNKHPTSPCAACTDVVGLTQHTSP